MDVLLQDIRTAIRSLRKTPAITALAIACFAVGVGVHATLFSVLDGAFFKPLGFDHPERTLVLNDRRAKQEQNNRSGLSWLNYEDLQSRTTSFSEFAAFTGRSLTLTDGDEPERLFSSMVSSSLFPMLGEKPILGRGFRPEDDRKGAAPVLLISHELWQRRYAGDPRTVGRVIPVSGKMTTIIGVMPKGFRFPDEELLWIPLAPNLPDAPRGERVLSVYGRLAPKATAERANAELKSVSAQLAAEYPDENGGWSTSGIPMKEAFLEGEVKIVLWAMMGATLCVLLIACANVANLLLARAAERHREIAIRTAIGAGRTRILRQLLTESVLIAICGAGIGVLLAFWGLDLIQNAFPPTDRAPTWIHWAVDGRTMVYTLVVAVLAGLGFGFAPALQTLRANLTESLKEGARGTGGGKRTRLRSTLVVTQVALSLVLLVTAALFVRSFIALQNENPGYDVDRIMTMRLYLPGDPYNADRVKLAKLQDIQRRIEGLPGVESATLSNTIAIDGGGGGDAIVAEGRDVAKGEEPLLAFSGVDAHWFRTYGIPILKGRDLTQQEATDSAAVAVVMQSFAKKLWGDDDPIGRRFRMQSDPNHRWITVVGEVADFRMSGLDSREPDRVAFLPYLYVPARNNGISIRVAGGDPTRIAKAAREAVRAADAGLPVFEVNPLTTVKQLSFWQYGLFGKMFTIFGVIALVLALTGVYGLISYGVAQRTHEIGVRMALGARSEDVLKMVIGQGARLAGLGIGVGLLAAWGAGVALQSILWHTPAADPISFGVIVSLLTGTAVVASWLPARRAAAVDPMVALREE